MSYIRIAEYSSLPAATDAGQWFVPEKRGGAVRIDRDGEALAADNALAKQAGGLGERGVVVKTWTGFLSYRCGTLRQGDILYLLKYPVPFDYMYEFDAWFQYEHMPLLLEEPAWYGCELFRAIGASTYTFAALQYLERSALTSDARNRSVDTPWWHRLKKHDWFDKQFVRMIMQSA